MMRIITKDMDIEEVTLFEIMQEGLFALSKEAQKNGIEEIGEDLIEVKDLEISDFKTIINDNGVIKTIRFITEED